MRPSRLESLRSRILLYVHDVRTRADTAQNSHGVWCITQGSITGMVQLLLVSLLLQGEQRRRCRVSDVCTGWSRPPVGIGHNPTVSASCRRIPGCLTAARTSARAQRRCSGVRTSNEGAHEGGSGDTETAAH